MTMSVFNHHYSPSIDCTRRFSVFDPTRPRRQLVCLHCCLICWMFLQLSWTVGKSVLFTYSADWRAPPATFVQILQSFIGRVKRIQLVWWNHPNHWVYGPIWLKQWDWCGRAKKIRKLYLYVELFCYSCNSSPCSASCPSSCSCSFSVFLFCFLLFFFRFSSSCFLFFFFLLFFLTFILLLVLALLVLVLGFVLVLVLLFLALLLVLVFCSSSCSSCCYFCSSCSCSHCSCSCSSSSSSSFLVLVLLLVLVNFISVLLPLVLVLVSLVSCFVLVLVFVFSLLMLWLAGLPFCSPYIRYIFQGCDIWCVVERVIKFVFNWAAFVHMFHMPKPAITFVFKLLRLTLGLIPYIAVAKVDAMDCLGA